MPERTADSMKNFWKKQLSKTLEEFLIESIHTNADFCLSFKDIPNPNFVEKFKKQYENEFLKLQALSRLDRDGGDMEGGIMSDDDDLNTRGTYS